MGAALGRLAKKTRPSAFAPNEETGQTIIAGMGELHLEVIVDRMLREFRVEANVGQPQVAYRETITEPVDAEGKLRAADRRQGPVRPCRGRARAAGARQGLRVRGQDRRRLGPARVHRRPIEQGIREAHADRRPGRFPVVDIKVTLVDGSYHEVDSSEMAFKIAGSLALKEGVRRGQPVILEPIMKVEVTTPDDFMGDVIGDLNCRRGQIQGMEMRANAQVVRAFVPLARCSGMRPTCARRPRDARLFDGVRSLRAGADGDLAEEMMAKARRD